jgi:hypothetical protein
VNNYDTSHYRENNKSMSAMIIYVSHNSNQHKLSNLRN